MDYEEQRSTDAEPGMPDDDSTPDNAADTSSEGLGTESSLMSDQPESTPTPPEWPAADLQASHTDEPETAAGEMMGGSGQMMAADTEPMDADAEMAGSGQIIAAHTEPMDAGDDSDAPVQLDDATAPAGHIKAETVDLSQGGVKSIDATTVTLSQGGAGQVHADTMSVEQSGVGLARVNTLTLGSGASAFAVVADKATVEEGSNAFLVISRSFSGETRPTIDWRGAMAFGAGLGLVISILRRHR